MYVCLCKAITERDLHSLVESVGPDLECVQRTTGATTDCGSCLRKVERILERHNKHADTAPAATSSSK